MQVTIDSSEDLERVLDVVGALYGVRLTVAQDKADDSGEDQGIIKIRH